MPGSGPSACFACICLNLRKDSFLPRRLPHWPARKRRRWIIRAMPPRRVSVTANMVGPPRHYHQDGRTPGNAHPRITTPDPRRERACPDVIRQAVTRSIQGGAEMAGRRCTIPIPQQGALPDRIAMMTRTADRPSAYQFWPIAPEHSGRDLILGSPWAQFGMDQRRQHHNPSRRQCFA
jgi:hypothetical protein